MTEFTASLSPLPTGRSTFHTLREDGSIYVDKTELICELAAKREKFFLARPRRFGKSLLVSTFESLFSTGTKDFKGLAAEKLWNDKTYDVVTLDFSPTKDCATLEAFEKKFSALISREFGELGFHYNESASADIVDQLSEWLKTRPSASLVLLVDEYDAPLTAHLNEEALFSSIRDRLSNFYITIKSREGCLRFFFMTGITKFQSASIFSAFNPITDISPFPRYSSLLGYTEEELLACFNPYLQRAADRLGLTKEKLVSKMREMYDGFCFDMQATSHVYVPWSVLQFLAYPENGLLNYWFDSAGKPTVLMNYLKAHQMISPDDYSNDRTLTLDALLRSADLATLEPATLLFQAGYLSIAKRNRNTVVLRYPNQEMRESMALLYTEIMLQGNSVSYTASQTLADVLSTGHTDDVMNLINSIISGFTYANWALNSEADCRRTLYIMLASNRLRPQTELHNALGRSDIEVEDSGLHWVFELKFSAEGDSQDYLLKTAVEQMRNRRYGDAARPFAKLKRVAAVFSGKERRFTHWMELTAPDD